MDKDLSCLRISLYSARLPQATPAAPVSLDFFRRLLRARSRFRLIAASVSLFLTPSVSSYQSGVAAATDALMTDEARKMLMVPQSKPAAPLFPSTSEAGIVDPMSAVNAPLSMRPSLRFRGEAADARDVSLAIVHEEEYAEQTLVLETDLVFIELRQTRFSRGWIFYDLHVFVPML